MLTTVVGADSFDFVHHDLGGERWQRTGECAAGRPELDQLAASDAIILVPSACAPGSKAIPSGLLERGLLLKLRFAFATTSTCVPRSYTPVCPRAGRLGHRPRPNRLRRRP